MAVITSDRIGNARCSYIGQHSVAYTISSMYGLFIHDGVMYSVYGRKYENDKSNVFLMRVNIDGKVNQLDCISVNTAVRNHSIGDANVIPYRDGYIASITFVYTKRLIFVDIIRRKLSELTSVSVGANVAWDPAHDRLWMVHSKPFCTTIIDDQDKRIYINEYHGSIVSVVVYNNMMIIEGLNGKMMVNAITGERILVKTDAFIRIRPAGGSLITCYEVDDATSTIMIHMMDLRTFDRYVIDTIDCSSHRLLKYVPWTLSSSVGHAFCE